MYYLCVWLELETSRYLSLNDPLPLSLTVSKGLTSLPSLVCGLLLRSELTVFLLVVVVLLVLLCDEFPKSRSLVVPSISSLLKENLLDLSCLNLDVVPSLFRGRRNVVDVSNESSVRRELCDQVSKGETPGANGIALSEKSLVDAINGGHVVLTVAIVAVALEGWKAKAGKLKIAPVW